MVPNGWNTLALSEITKEKISYGIVQAGPHVDDGIPYIKSADVGGEIDVDSLQRTAKEIHHKYRRSSVHPNDIVFSLRGNIARTSIVPTSLQEANLTQGTARISVNDKNDTKFVYYKLASTPILNRINALSKGSTFKEISLEELRKVKLPLPPLEEQRKIAKILSTWDKAISTTERLIDNSKQQKKALMQQLLTGKKRLLDDSGKPFEGEWEEVLVGNVAELTAGGTPSTKKSEYWGGDIPWMNSGEINLKQIFSVEGRITEIGLQKSSTKQIPKHSVLIALAGQGRTRGTVAINRIELCTNQSIAAIMPNRTQLYTEFLYFNLDNRYQELRSMSTGDGGRGGLNLSILKSIKLQLPSIFEQKKIASVLTNADQEIELLEQQLADLKQEKKALMQQLLTGKRRVKLN